MATETFALHSPRSYGLDTQASILTRKADRRSAFRRYRDSGASRICGASGGASSDEAGPVTLKHPLDDSPITIPDSARTDEVKAFLASGENPYAGNASAVNNGKTLYGQWCASCHLADGTGRMGSNLVDATVRYPRVESTAGFFEVVHSGATGAMQAFGDRVSADEILKIEAYVETLRQ